MDIFAILNFEVWENSILSYLVFLAAVIAAWIIGYIVNWFIRAKLKKLAEKTVTKLDDLIVGILGGPVVLIVFCIGLSMGAKAITGGFQSLVAQIYGALVYVAAAWILFRTIDGIYEHYLGPLLEKTETKIDDVLVPVLIRFVKVIVAIFVGLLALERFNFRVAPVITFLLNFGLMLVATAAVSTIWLLRSVVGGLVILFNRPFGEGDEISFNKIEGKVEKIEIHRTIIVAKDGSRTAVPNHEFVIHPVQLVNVAPPAPKPED
ncbi:MAG TPA: mechanosensitive ion channel [Polyangiaceae bacterium]|nr:mechanosensitive ion channel [Polyangiaceae bacterium]